MAERSSFSSSEPGERHQCYFDAHPRHGNPEFPDCIIGGLINEATAGSDEHYNAEFVQLDWACWRDRFPDFPGKSLLDEAPVVVAVELMRDFREKEVWQELFVHYRRRCRTSQRRHAQGYEPKPWAYSSLCPQYGGHWRSQDEAYDQEMQLMEIAEGEAVAASAAPPKRSRVSSHPPRQRKRSGKRVKNVAYEG